VAPNSIAHEVEITPGDRVIAVDHKEIRDILDFQYATAEEQFNLLIEKLNGEIWEIQIERDYDEPLGLTFETVASSGIKTCRNNCVFCFVAQTPKHMRATLYQKDDDYRLSLTQGSFITLTNLSEEDFERIIKFRLSPLYISVHAWNPQVRVRLMRNPKAAELPRQIERLAQAGITMHAQIVLVPGYNDSEVLEETVTELGHFYPAVQSVGVVPVGLTKHRTGLPELRPVTSAEAQAVLDQGITWQNDFRKRWGINFVYFSDEFYVLAGRPFPQASEYDEFPQLENGIGMAAKFAQELQSLWPSLPTSIGKRRIHLLTGVSATPFFRYWVDRLEQRIAGLTLELHTIVNNFFGKTVTVAGLLTAQDIANQVGNLNGERFLIPQNMLKADADIFLDDYSVSWLEEKINGRASIVENNATSFIQALLL